MALQEFYNTGDDIDAPITVTTWRGQTWTTTSAYNITSVKLKLYRGGTPPTNVTVSIRATSAGLPTGADLTSGSIAGSTVTEGTPGSFIEIPLTPYALSNATKYAIVCRVDDAGCTWRVDNSSPSYAGGNGCTSTNSGVNWTTGGWDSMFEIYGGLVIVEGTKTVTVAATVSLSTDLTVRVEGTKTVTVAVMVSLASENYVSQSGFPTDRPSDYDGDEYWDEDAGAWGSTRTTIPGNWVQNVLAISEEGEIYFRTV